ncbi:hypothetical protein LPJ53_002527 [Coemansia erecta]|uniref:Zn(2)-C6 fungal-type domain-containing protein n=1 Tax=Coemansia erecta TaxID=147472 RepID=A0A9W7Y3C9_9FUNG|nr:hypothetical protein LPJ53_002527 [Coemansia erecta]
MNRYSQDSDVDSLPKTRKKRAQVKNACVNCQRACKRCDSGRPCQRCVKHSLQDTCVDSTRKPRAKGIKRGPYKKRNKEKENDGRASTSARNARARASTRIKQRQEARYSPDEDEDEDDAEGDGDYTPTIRVDDQTDHVARLSSARMARFWRSPMLPRSPASSIGEGSSDYETAYRGLRLPPLGTFDASSDSDTDQSPMPLTLLEASMPTPHSSSPLSLLSDVALNSSLAAPKHTVVSRFSYAYRVPPPRFPLAVESARDAFSRPASAASSPRVDDAREVAEMESSVQSPVPGSRTVRRLSRLLSGTRISENSRWVDAREGDCQRGWSEGTSAVCLTPPVSDSNRHHVQPVSESPPEDAAQLYESMSLYRISNEQPH